MYKIIGIDRKEYGPANADQVRQWIAERRLNGQSLVWAEGATEWQPLSKFPEFAAALAGAAPVPAPLSVPGVSASPEPTNGLATASLVMGILSWFCCGLGVIFGVLAIVFGFVALSQIRDRPNQAGKPMAIAGIVLGILHLLTLATAAAFGLFGETLHRLMK